ncbi:MAG TPA: hypothetical protein VEI97_20365, partial [bacterium]|nr:hypothetical protein [bacterium]
MAKKHRPKAAAPDPPPPAAPAEIAAESAPEHVEGGLTIGRPTALGITVARWEERLAVFLAVFFLFVFLTQDYGGHLNRGSWNDQSRFATIQALVEQGTFAIDNTRWGWWTGDKVFAGEHFYSTKPPLLSVLGAAVYWPLHRMLGLSYFNDAQAPTIYYVVTLTLIGVPMALAAALFYDLLARFGLALRWRLVGVLGFALGSLYLPYSTIFQNHTVAGIAGLGSFAGLLIASQGPGRFWPLALAGLGVALALATDIVGGAPYAFAAITWLAWRHTAGGRPAAELGPFALGLAVPLTIHFACNYAITGDFSPIYAK